MEKPLGTPFGQYTACACAADGVDACWRLPNGALVCNQCRMFAAAAHRADPGSWEQQLHLYQVKHARRNRERRIAARSEQLKLAVA